MSMEGSLMENGAVDDSADVGASPALPPLVQYILDNFHIDKDGDVIRNDGYYGTTNRTVRAYTKRILGEIKHFTTNQIYYVLITSKFPMRQLKISSFTNLMPYEFINDDISNYIYNLLVRGGGHRIKLFSIKKIKLLCEQKFCMQTKIKFRLDDWMFKPSLDRPISKLPYRDDNIQVTCEAYNMLKNSSADEQAKNWLEEYIKCSRKE